MGGQAALGYADGRALQPQGGQLPAGEERYGGPGVTVIPQNKSSEATAALAVLGYSPAEIAVALKGLDLEGLSLEEIVRQALRKMIK